MRTCAVPNDAGTMRPAPRTSTSDWQVRIKTGRLVAAIRALRRKSSCVGADSGSSPSSRGAIGIRMRRTPHTAATARPARRRGPAQGGRRSQVGIPTASDEVRNGSQQEGNAGQRRAIRSLPVRCRHRNKCEGQRNPHSAAPAVGICGRQIRPDPALRIERRGQDDRAKDAQDNHRCGRFLPLLPKHGVGSRGRPRCQMESARLRGKVARSHDC